MNADSVSAAQRRGTAQPLEAAQLDDTLLTLKNASAIAGLSQATIYRKANEPDSGFPRLIKLGARCTRIRAGELRAWLAQQGA